MRTLYFLLCLFVVLGCVSSDTTEKEQEDNSSNPKVFCIPPLTVDTSTVKMQMLLNGSFYKPIFNGFCVVPNFFLGINQLWVNGSAGGALKVVTLKFPPDIKVGTYDLMLNTKYDALFVPSPNADLNFTCDSGKLKITKHDVTNRIIEGTFDFQASCLTCPALNVTTVKEGCFWTHY